jgi:hypothetical protein
MAGLVPAIPIRKSVAPQSIEITGTRPVMTSAFSRHGTTTKELIAYDSAERKS